MKNQNLPRYQEIQTESPAQSALKGFLSESGTGRRDVVHAKELVNEKTDDLTGNLSHEIEIMNGHLELLENLAQKTSFLTRELRYLTKA